jgi:predicted RNA-binding Zn ribbon-like protein
MSKRSDAPGALDVVRSFVNTHDLEDNTDAIAAPDQLSAWLTEHGLLDGAGSADAAQVARAAGLREALRHMLLANGGVPPDPEAPATVDAIARHARVGVRFHPDGSSSVEPEASGVDGALGRIVAVVAGAMADGTWPRLKACLADDCQWAFYDHTRNHSGRWCDMAVCGNRTKVRAFRTRRSGPDADES